MLNVKTGLNTAVCLAACSLLSSAASAAIIYDNSETFEGVRTAEGTLEHGDVIGFAGTERTLTTIQFEYFLTPTRSGNETAIFSLYSVNNGVISSAPLYQSSAFDIAAGTTAAGYGQRQIGNLALTVPDSVAWTVTFGGLEAGEDAGLLFYTSANGVGTNPTFLDPQSGTQQQYTVRHEANGSWSILMHDDAGDNFGARFTAVPEPTTWALMLGGLAVMGLIRRKK
jgi:hypothetical protein